MELTKVKKGLKYVKYGCVAIAGLSVLTLSPFSAIYWGVLAVAANVGEKTVEKVSNGNLNILNAMKLSVSDLLGDSWFSKKKSKATAKTENDLMFSGVQDKKTVEVVKKEQPATYAPVQQPKTVAKQVLETKTEEEKEMIADFGFSLSQNKNNKKRM